MFGSKKRQRKREKEEREAQERREQAASDAKTRAAYEELRRVQEEILHQQRAAQQASAPSSSGAPAKLDEHQRFPTDERGFVISDGGGPIVFASAKEAATWIFKHGNKISPVQILQHENHPFMKAYTVQVIGHADPQDEAALEAKAKAARKEYLTPQPAFQQAAAASRDLLKEQLHNAVVNGDVNETNRLVRLVTPAQKTLNFSAGNRPEEWTRVLINNGAAPTPGTLHIAVVRGDVDTTNLLVKLVTPAKKTLDFAAGNRPAEWTEVLVNHGAEPTPETLHIAIVHDNVDAANFLLKRGVIPAEKTLNHVVGQKRKNDADVLIGYGAKPTPETLHIATLNNDVDTANLLIEKGVMPAKKTLDYVIERQWQNWIEAFSRIVNKRNPARKRPQP
jgi:hypothetical protein